MTLESDLTEMSVMVLSTSLMVGVAWELPVLLMVSFTLRMIASMIPYFGRMTDGDAKLKRLVKVCTRVSMVSSLASDDGDGGHECCACDEGDCYFEGRSLGGCHDCGLSGFDYVHFGFSWLVLTANIESEVAGEKERAPYFPPFLGEVGVFWFVPDAVYSSISLELTMSLIAFLVRSIQRSAHA